MTTKPHRRRCSARAIVLVTHNIEEAVFMCDRILVLSSNPGRISAEIAVPLPHPRDRLAAGFRAVVDDIYARMTAGPAPGRDNKSPTTTVGLTTRLPIISAARIASLAETLGHLHSMAALSCPRCQHA